MATFEPLISIIIPVYNGGSYMRDAIDSALNQSYPNIEIIVVNDGSNDNGETDRIAKSYGDRIRYYSKENGGVSSALNLGIEVMKGEYFSWLSHDDIYCSDKIEKSVLALSELRDKTTIVSCQSRHIDKDGNYIKQKRTNDLGQYKLYDWKAALMRLQKNGTMNGCSLLIHKDVFLRCGMFDEELRFNQDGFMWNKIFLEGYSLLSIPTVCVLNRIHDKQVTQTKQHLFHEDCDKMSQYLIPRLISISTKEKNFVLFYIRYNAKYSNWSVVRKSVRAAQNLNLLSFRDYTRILSWSLYGLVRPSLRKVYYKVAHKL